MLDEKESMVAITGIAINDEYLIKNKFITREHLLLATDELLRKFEGQLTSPGIYSLELRVTKID